MLELIVMLVAVWICLAVMVARMFSNWKSERPLLDGWSAAFGAVALIVVMLLLSSITDAQSTGYRYTQNGIVFAGSGSVCFEPTYNAGPDVCLYRSGIGHMSQTTGTLAADPDVAGTKTLAAGAGTVTFANAFTAAPIAVCTDQTAANAVKCSTSTTALTIAGTTTDVIAYELIPNPN